MHRAARHLLVLIVAAVLATPVVLVGMLETGAFDRPLRVFVTRKISQMTGGRAEMGAFRFRLRGLRVQLDNFTLHGREKPGEPPLFHANRILVKARVISFWRRRVALKEVLIDNPEVAVQVYGKGQTNLPVPPVRRTAKTPWRQELFNLEIGHLEVSDGHLIYANRVIPLNVNADQFHFVMNYYAPALGAESYLGALNIGQVNMAWKRDMPFSASLQTRYTLTQDSFSLDEMILKLEHSEVRARGELANFATPSWTFHTRGRVDLADVARIFRKPNSPRGVVDWTENGSYAGGKLAFDGHYDARDIALRYQWFHAAGIQSWGRFASTPTGLNLPEFHARAFGGALAGRLQLVYKGLKFRTETKFQGGSLGGVFAAVDNPSLPLHTLHWIGTMSVDSVSEWTADFKHFHTQGVSIWTPSESPAPGLIPTSARLQYDYSNDRHTATLMQSEITTPKMHLTVDGTLGKNDSALNTTLDAENLLEWDDFINYIRGKDKEAVRVAGEAQWRGRILGPIDGPEFSGHVAAEDAQYGRMRWDRIEGDMDYSPDGFQFKHAQAALGKSRVNLDLSLSFDGAWNFLPESPWSLRASLQSAPSNGIQSFFGTSYPVSGLISGEFQGEGTRAAPQLDGTFQVGELVAYGFHLDEFAGQFRLEPRQFCFEQAKLTGAGGQVDAHFCYGFEDRTTDFLLTGANLALARMLPGKGSQLAPAGTMGFHAEGHGPLLAPAGKGEMTISGLSIGPEKEGNVRAQFTSDGKKLQAAVDFSSHGQLHGKLALGLADGYPLSGNLQLQQVDLDPLIESALHLTALTGHSSVDGTFQLAGDLKQPNSIEVQANITRVSLNYEYVQLENQGPLRVKYSGGSVQIEQANLHGPNSDFQFGGQVNFTGDRAVDVRVNGTVNLRLARAFVPNLDAQGAAQVSGGAAGTLDRPDLAGQIRVSDASAEYGDFPVGLNHISGIFVFDRGQLLFENVSAQSGGGNLKLSGSVALNMRPVRFEVNAVATSVRIRYPAGLSWTGGAALKLAGTQNAGLLSGNVVVDRLTVSPNASLGSFLGTSGGAAVSTPASSTFLQNLQFDISAQTSPGARMEGTGARLDMEGAVRLRGTWDHPVMLGNVHILNGTLAFQGTKYDISRGDINFANPFRLDPVMDVEATTTVQQYVITLNFTGPVSHLSLAYRSDPPLPSGDIIALLASGSTGQQNASLGASSQQTQNYGATALLSAAISSQLGGRVERLFGISRFRVDPFLAGTTTEQNAAARVTIEQQVTHKLTVTYSTNATSNQQQVIQIEYAVSPRVSLVALRDINGIFSVAVKFTKRFR